MACRSWSESSRLARGMAVNRERCARVGPRAAMPSDSGRNAALLRGLAIVADTCVNLQTEAIFWEAR
eukprot:8155536-Pyramimonas_sp.AAC.1